MMIYGLSTCDTCRKARAALPDATFRDIRAQPLDATELQKVLDTFGAAAVNRASTTWRNLDEAERARPLPTLLADHPTLLKRPLIRVGDRLFQGWTAPVQAAVRQAMADG
ncbi:arsenate reductase family protein [Falsirhodobacter sp. 20TX0035]|uniref:arsenate reductase family protein n=1 Tax=Falsirhodobacter sp. 20TX0035 TaxID=3022019 RepID=UPI00232CB0BB|nr:ArsC/Spx/MgsR family protein [Falsirhodobacter sp. 20TX0035]MDB6453086.1 arsenate reductase [Falsirhodobacter sp. 20TX0035]